jgi:hypothetical protein
MPFLAESLTVFATPTMVSRRELLDVAIGYESAAVNDQLVNVAPGQAYAPLAYGASLSGPGMWPRNGVFNVPPVVPSPAQQAQMAPTQIGSGANYGGTIPLPTTQSASGNTMHGTKSPVLWALAFFVIGMLLLMHVHYR